MCPQQRGRALLGVSIRRMEKPVESFGVTTLSKSQVSTRVREHGRVVTVHPSRHRPQR